MRKHVSRLNGKDRMLVSVSNADFLQSVRHTAQLTQQWRAEGLLKHAWSEQSLLDTYRLFKTKVVDQITDVPFLVWDPALPTRPQLDRGQHRRKAYLETHASTWSSLTPSSATVCFFSPFSKMNNCSW
jgi:hypothetical protein